MLNLFYKYFIKVFYFVGLWIGGSKMYWRVRYYFGGTSGAGSYERLAEFKSEIINQFLKTEDIHSVIEWGCGDGNQLIKLQYKKYIGYDISVKAVERCRTHFSKDKSKKFICYDGDLVKIEDKAELALSLDVIYHLVEDSVFATYMKNLFSSSQKFVCIYSSNFDDRKTSHVKHREFTKYISKNFPEWKLIHIVKNKYPYDPDKPQQTSLADFYFFQKVRETE